MARDSTAHERADETPEATATDASLRTWGVVAVLFASLIGFPVLFLTEIEVGLLTAAGLPGALGVSRQTLLGVLALVPGFVLGGLSLVVMTGWE